jgi:hypothetical protein
VTPNRYSALRIDDLDRSSGRPPSSPGWGRLVAVKDKGIPTSDGACAFVEAGRTRVAADSIYAREHPYLFRPVDRRDKRTAVMHRRNLQRHMRQLEAELRRPTAASAYGLIVATPPRTWEL